MLALAPLTGGTPPPLPPPLPAQVYLATWFGTEVAVKILIVGHVDSASEAQRALSLSAPIMQKLEAEASLLASLRWVHAAAVAHAAAAVCGSCAAWLGVVLRRGSRASSTAAPAHPDGAQRTGHANLPGALSLRCAASERARLRLNPFPAHPPTTTGTRT